MRDDLLDAQAAVDWAVSDLPILQSRIDAWLGDHPYGLYGDIDSQPGKKLIRLRDVKPIPLTICAEAGIVIHGIRSSLDMLAVSLAERNGAVDPKDVYFPIWRDDIAFNDPEDRTVEKIKRLSAADQAVIKNLKPYNGGHDLLYALHTLDLTRKHRRLLSAYVSPRRIIVPLGAAIGDGAQFMPDWQGFKNDSVIAITNPDTVESDTEIALEIRIVDVSEVATKPLVTALDKFASLAASIIKIFDTPEF